MAVDEYALFALACEAHEHDIPEAAAAIFRKLLQRHPHSPLAADAIFYLQNGYQLPPRPEPSAEPFADAQRAPRNPVRAGALEQRTGTEEVGAAHEKIARVS